MEWSQQQQAIFQWFRTPPTQHLVVRARAGTGKTTTIVQAVRHIEAGASILVAAFNKRIQLELQKKLEGAAECLTLHGLGYKFLRGAWGDGLKVDPAVEEERIEKVLAAMNPGDPLPPWDVMGGIKKLIGVAKGTMPEGSIADLAVLATLFGCEVDERYDARWIAEVASRAMLAAQTPDPLGRITFDDMLYLPVVMNFGMPLYDWVVVDEAQDMSYSQLRLAQLAVKAGGHIVVVGDDRQAIYAFRGADSHAIDRLKTELQADELGLNTTYRCGKKIVAKAQELVADFFHPPDAHDGEVDAITLNELIDTVAPGDVILSRVNAPLVPLCLSLIRRQVPAKIEGRDIGKLLTARAKKLKANTVTEFLAKLTKWSNTASARIIARGKAVDAQLQQIRDVEETLAALATDARSVKDIYDRCDRLFDDAAVEGKEGKVILSSVHKAKGLEWNRVFLLEDTLFVFGQKKGDMEESNIAYVATTRARNHLTLVKGKHAAA